MNIRPLGDNVLIKPKKVDEKSKTGIIMSVNNEEQTLTGKIEGIGKGVTDLKVGEMVVYAPYSGKEIGCFLLVSQNDVMGVIEKEEKEKVFGGTSDPLAQMDKRNGISTITKNDLKN